MVGEELGGKSGPGQGSFGWGGRRWVRVRRGRHIVGRVPYVWQSRVPGASQTPPQQLLPLTRAPEVLTPAVLDALVGSLIIPRVSSRSLPFVLSRVRSVLGASVRPLPCVLPRQILGPVPRRIGGQEAHWMERGKFWDFARGEKVTRGLPISPPGDVGRKQGRGSTRKVEVS